MCIDIEETDVESVSEGSGDDVIDTTDDHSLFRLGFTASTTDSLPFTVYDADRTVTRTSQRVCYYYYYYYYYNRFMALCLGLPK